MNNIARANGLRYVQIMWRLPLLLLHLFIGLPLALISFLPALRDIQTGGVALKVRMIRWWSRWLCRVLGVYVRPGSALPASPALVVANHSSWLDILVLSSIGHLHFVSKAEVARWPVIGMVAKASGVIFHRRGSSDSLSDVAEQVVQSLNSGHDVAIFPEGRVNDGTGIHRFHARLFKSAVETNCPIVPVCIRYLRGELINVETSFAAAESFGANLFRLLLAPGAEAAITVLPAFSVDGLSRRQLAERAFQCIDNEYTKTGFPGDTA